MDTAEAISRSSIAGRPPPTPAQVLAAMFEPLGAAWTGGPTEALLVGGRDAPSLSEYGEALLEWAEADPASAALNASLRVLVSQLRQLRQQGRGAEADQRYQDFRRTLIEGPVLTRSEVAGWAARHGLSWTPFYEEVPPSCLTGPEHRKAWRCPGCGWTLVRLRADRLGCQAPRCRDQGLLFDIEPDGELRVLTELRAERFLTDEHLRLTSAARRHFQLPGRDELELKSRLESLGQSVEVRLWPDLDAYDLHVRHLQGEWKIDVKSWRSGRSLATHLRSHPPEEGVIVAIPDHLPDPLWEVRRAGTRVRVLSFAEVVTLVSGGQP